YCKWLETHWGQLDEASDNSGLRPKKIRLPTEAEWHASVFGSGPVCRFPWAGAAADGPVGADTWERYANTGKVLESPTPVGLFPLGEIRPHGLADACGNVWEWQANEFDESYRGIALRGGAYTTAAADAGCDLRGWREPAGRDTDL